MLIYDEQHLWSILACPAAAARQLRAPNRDAPLVVTLVTSRTVLRIRGEHEFAVPTLRFLWLEPAGTLQTCCGTPR